MNTQKRKQSKIYIPPGPRLGDKVIEFSHVNKAFDDKMLVEDLSFFSVPAGAIVGVIGGNGAGKSTLFKMITGQESPDSGTVELGDTVELAYVDQSRDALDGSKTVWAEVSDEQDMITVSNYSIPSRAYLGRFNFKGGDQQKFVKDLSGGERNRLYLAKTLKQGGNVLLLDEPLILMWKPFTCSRRSAARLPWHSACNLSRSLVLRSDRSTFWPTKVIHGRFSSKVTTRI